MANNFDTDLIKRVNPRSVPQTRSLFSNDKIKTLTKLKIQEYIESFFSRVGENHDLLGIVSPRGVTYNIDKSFEPATDPTQRKLQVARYFSELRGVVPCILIADGGVIPVMHNIGLISDSYSRDGNWNGHYPILRQIPITILAATRDQESADELVSILSLLFNELRNLAGGNYITGKAEEGETWTVTLPNEGVPASQVNEVDIQGEPVEKIFYSEITMVVMYEDVIRVQEKLANFEQNSPFKVNEPNLSQNPPPSIEIADTIPINTQVHLIVRNMENHHRIVMSDGTKATLSYNMMLTPRKLGKVAIQVIDIQKRPEERIVAQKTIEII
jgi:hypothetical protein